MVPGLPDACCDSDKLTETKLESFTSLNTEEVRKLIEGFTKKTCMLDPVPTSIMTSCIDVLLPVITKIVNLSLESGMFAGDWKCALINPLLKKDNLDLLFNNYRPISNLQFVSKLTERAMLNQMHDHIPCTPIIIQKAT